jgi:pyruvate/2-oxoglutarate dehydrogenase complex dihydrolipoamide acyltransferase (E2) component
MSVALKKTPLARVKDEFGGKDKLVDKIVGVLDSGDESRDDLRKRLLGVSNTKLIRLHGVATKTKAAGGHDKLATETAEKLGRAKDKDYVAKLGTLSNGRLLDLQSTVKAPKAAAAKPAKAAKPAAKPTAKSTSAKKA